MSTLHQVGDPTRVRLADANDENELMALTQLLHGEIGIFAFSEHKIRDLLRGALQGPVERRRGVIGVIGAPGHIEGAIYLELTSAYYSDEFCLQELFNYVLPPARKTSASRDLIAFAKSISDRFGLPLLIGVLTNERTEAKVRLYRKQLGEPVGAFFAHNVTHIRGAF